MGDMMVNVVGCLGVCTYAFIGMKFKPDWFDGKLVMTASQIDEQAKLMAAAELAAEDSHGCADETAADYALDETAEYSEAATAAPEAEATEAATATAEAAAESTITAADCADETDAR